MNADSALNERAQTFERTGLGLAMLMLLGSLYMSIGMGLKACPLCLYERSLVMAVVGVHGLREALRGPREAHVLKTSNQPPADLVHGELDQVHHIEVATAPRRLFGAKDQRPLSREDAFRFLKVRSNEPDEARTLL